MDIDFLDLGRGSADDGAARSRPDRQDTGTEAPANRNCEPGDWLTFELDMELLEELGSDQGHLKAWVEDQVADAHPDYDIDAIEWRPRLWTGPGDARLVVEARALLATRRPDDGDEDAEYERVRDEEAPA